MHFPLHANTIYHTGLSHLIFIELIIQTTFCEQYKEPNILSCNFLHALVSPASYIQIFFTAEVP